MRILPITLAAVLLAVAGENPSIVAPPYARVLEPRGARGVMPIGKPVKIPTPLGLPPVPVPADNPPTAETIALGRKLFHEKFFSRDGSTACADCHDPKTAFADPRRFSPGVKQQLGGRHSMTLLNAASAEAA